MVATLLSAVLLFAQPMGIEITSDPLIRAGLWRMFADTRFGHAMNEEAAFIVRAADGALSLVRWPSSDAPHRSQWKAPVPAGAIAIAHTHPNGQPRPSIADSRTAEQWSMPVYVVTRTRIARTDGTHTETVVEGNWEPRPL
jgi:hypothetical protein